jgi:hypothetical protein
LAGISRSVELVAMQAGFQKPTGVSWQKKWEKMNDRYSDIPLIINHWIIGSYGR